MHALAAVVKCNTWTLPLWLWLAVHSLMLCLAELSSLIVCPAVRRGIQ